MKCLHEECNRKAVSKGCCDKHYRRLRKHGSINPENIRVVDEGDAAKRFSKKYDVIDSGCWIWKRGTSKNGKGVLYPKIHIETGTIGAHRYSYMLHYGKEIPKNMYVCHKCDTPLCVNPDHLFLGYHSDNMIDMVKKGRSHKGKGEHANRSVLTNKQAVEIRSINNMTQSEIAKIYGIAQTTVSRIKRKVSYNEV